MNSVIENTNDSELIMLYREDDEDAKNILFLKYKFIIDILIKKYNKIIAALNIDGQEVYSECTVGFSDALRNYQDDKDTTLPTFITLCVERRIGTLIRKYNREKYKIISDSYSLDYFYDQFGRPLIDILEDPNKEPLINMTDEENCRELIHDIEEILSKKENEVFKLMIKGFNYKQIAKILGNTPKQVDNTMQRLKQKIRNLLLEKKENEYSWKSIIFIFLCLYYLFTNKFTFDIIIYNKREWLHENVNCRNN